MHIIRTFFDIKQFEQSQAITPLLAAHLEQKLKDIKEALEPDADLKDFTLEKSGVIGLLEESDNNLSAIGLPLSFDEIMPEWVSRLEIAGETYYILYVLADNDYCLQVYLPDKIINENIRLWLSEQTLEEEKEPKYDLSTHAF